MERRPSCFPQLPATPRPSSVSAAFTLVELLTVIAIIGILASIAFPAIGSVRRSARATQCKSNMRQLGLAILHYADENRGLLPVEKNVNPNPVGVENPADTISWWMLIQKRLGLRFPTAGQDNLFMCPEAMNTYQKPARRTYGLNLAGAGGQDAVRLSSISAPSQALLLGETAENGVEGDGLAIIGFGTITNNTFDWRHKGNTQHIILADGSLRSIPKATMNDGTPSSLYRLLENLRK